MTSVHDTARPSQACREMLASAAAIGYDPALLRARLRFTVHPALAFAGLLAFVLTVSLWTELLQRVLDQYSPLRNSAYGWVAYLVLAVLATVLLLAALRMFHFPLAALA